MDLKLKEQGKEITLLEKDRYELVKIKTQMHKHEQKAQGAENEKKTLQEENKGLKQREIDLLSQIRQLEK